MAKSKTAPAREARPIHVVYLSMKGSEFKRLTAEKQAAILSIAHKSPIQSDANFVLTFKRETWFHLCGEVYSLLIGVRDFTLISSVVATGKDGAR